MEIVKRNWRVFLKNNFLKNDTISYSISDIKTIIESSEAFATVEDLNVADDLKNMIYLGKKTASLSVKPTREKMIPLYINEKGYDESIRKLLPDNSKIWDEKLDLKFKQFIEQLLENIVKYNYNTLFENQFPKLMKKKIDAQKRKRSNEDKKKGESKERIEQKLRFLYNKELERIRQINKLY